MSSSPSEIVLNLSHSLPLYFMEQYERLLAVINIKLPPNPSRAPSMRFWSLFEAHKSHKLSPQESSERAVTRAVTYMYKIFTQLGLGEIPELKAFAKDDVEIDTRVIDELKNIKEFQIALYKALNNLQGQLGPYQLERYRLSVTVAVGLDKIPLNHLFYDLFQSLSKHLASDPHAVAFTISVLERSGWGDTRSLKPFALQNFDLNIKCPVVDLCLTVADYYGNMSDRDFSSAKIYTSAVYLNNDNVSNLSRVDFTLLLLNRNKISVDDVSKIEDERRYPIFFKDYKKRCIELKRTPPPMVKPQSETHESTSTTTTQSTGGASVPETCSGDDETDGYRPNQPINVTPPTSVVMDSDRASSGISYDSPTTVTSTTDSSYNRQVTDPLDAPPTMKRLLKVLKPISKRWEVLGMSLEVNTEVISGSDDMICLGKVLTQWKTSGCSPYTWRNILEVIEDVLDEKDLVHEIEEKLQCDK